MNQSHDNQKQCEPEQSVPDAGREAEPVRDEPAAAETPSEQPAEQATGAAKAPLVELLEAAVAEREANYERWLRAQAEFDNYRKRSQRESAEHRRYQALPIVRDLLPALDNLKRAVAAAEAAQSADELVQGVKMVAKQIEDVLASHAVVPIEAAGQPFDPNIHQAVQQVPSADHPPMTVLDELERGYRLHDRIIRPSKVIVSSLPPEETE